jgi:hypothetical protein
VLFELRTILPNNTLVLGPLLEDRMVVRTPFAAADAVVADQLHVPGDRALGHL